jgi:hypothetical protein
MPTVVPRRAQNRLRLPRQRGQVDVDGPVDQPRVGRDLLSLLDEENVARNEPGCVHELPLAVSQDRRLLRQVGAQRLDGALGLALLGEGEDRVQNDDGEDGRGEDGSPAGEREAGGEEEKERERMRELARTAAA